MSQETALLPNGEGLLWAALRRHRSRAVRRSVDAFLPLLEPQSVNRPGARLIHDPADHGTARRVIGRRSSPHIVEHVDRQFFSGFLIAGDPHDQCENDSMRLAIERMECKLIAAGDRLDEFHPDLLGDGWLRLIGIEHITQRGLSVTPVLVWRCHVHRRR